MPIPFLYMKNLTLKLMVELIARLKTLFGTLLISLKNFQFSCQLGNRKFDYLSSLVTHGWKLKNIYHCVCVLSWQYKFKAKQT